MPHPHPHPADEFFNDCGIEKPPINIYQLAIVCEIEIEFANLSTKTQGNCLEMGGPIGKTIVLNRNRDWEWRRRRFTAAHELGHALFHTGFSFDQTDSRTVTKLERDANSFASRLLIPDSLLAQLANAYGFLTAKMVSEVFGVSYEAAAYRIFSSQHINLKDRESRRKFFIADKKLHNDFLFKDIPTGLSDWITLVISANDGNKQMLPFCMRCGCPKIDEYPQVCWGCGKNTKRYEGALPTSLSRRTDDEIANDDAAIKNLLR